MVASAFQFLRGDRDCGFVAEHQLVNRSTKLDWKLHEWKMVGFDSDIGAFPSVRTRRDDVLECVSFRSRHYVI